MAEKIGQIRQGDILLIPVAPNVRIPDGAQPQKEVILALGEMTGHAHRLRASEVYDWQDENGARFVRSVGGMGTLQHEDHDPTPAVVVVEDVTYRVVGQKTLNLADEWERVAD